MRFEDFTARHYQAGGIRLFARTSGDAPDGRPVLLLLHGYPQTSWLWHAVAPALAERFFVVCPDLRGYGDSDKPAGDVEHLAYSKRTMAADIVALADSLGVARFSLVGHDRGARVAHRLALDHPGRLERLCLLDIAPTLAMYEGTDQAFATAYFHWFFLIQPSPLPETLLGPRMKAWVRSLLASFGRGTLDWYTPAALAEYERCMDTPEAIHASCEDYRASAGIDLVHDRDSQAQGRRIACPLLAAWGERSIVARNFDARALWQSRAALPIRTAVLPTGHFIPDESPAALLAVLEPFLSAPPAGAASTSDTP